MVRRNGKHGDFYGCQRWPLCVGSVPITQSVEKPYDSYTQLLMEAHGNAVHYLARPDMLGRVGCVTWWLERPIAFTSLKLLEELIDEASAEASSRGPAVDFIQEAHDWRVLSTRKRIAVSKKYAHLLQPENLRKLPKPKFTRRWDSSDIDQIEAVLSPLTNPFQEASWQQRKV